MRSWSSRCAIEITLTRGRPLSAVEQAIDVERFALEPGAEAGRRQQLIELHRQREAILRREERFEIDHADLGDRRRSGSARSAPRRSRSRPARQLSVKSVDEQRVLAAAHRLRVDAGQRQHARGGRRDAIAQQIRVVHDFRIGRRERLHDRQRPARRCCPACRARTPPQRAAARCARRPAPTRRGPSTISPLRRRQTPRRSGRPGAPRRHRPTARNPPAASFGKVSSRLPRSPFGSIAMTGMPSIAASSIRPMPRPVLPLPVMPAITPCVTRSDES